MKFKRIISSFLIVLFILTPLTSLQTKKVYADSFKVVTLGADLTREQKESMMKYFGVTKNDANILEVTKNEEDKYLSKLASKEQIGTRSISCSYVEPTSNGGLNISTHNISWVTENMIRNALITAGIKNANVKAAAPFVVSGTAALTGILKGFESSEGGQKIDENKKKVANEELMVTGDLGEKIGKDQAANLINEVKKDVVKQKPKSEKEIQKIVLNVTNNFGTKLSNEDMQKITSLMSKINSLDLDFKQLKKQFNDVSEKLKGTLNSEETKGFIGKVKTFFKAIKNFFVKLFEGIVNFFKNIFSSDNNNKNTTSNSENNTNNIENKEKSSEKLKTKEKLSNDDKNLDKNSSVDNK